MRNIAFVVWMVGYPLICSIGEHLAYLQGKRYSDGLEAASALTSLLIWALVGKALYEKKPPEEPR